MQDLLVKNGLMTKPVDPAKLVDATVRETALGYLGN